VIRKHPRKRAPQTAGIQGKPRPSNFLLRALSAPDRDRLAPHLEVVSVPIRQFLHRPGDTLDFVYFPESGFCSELTVLENGDMVEIATVGREGVVGIFAVDDGQVAPSAAMIQAEMTSYRLPARIVRQEFQRGGELHQLIARYSHAHTAFIMQSTACNAVHTVEQRLARWLLMARDRVGTNDFPMTQEFLAMMLGVARPTVTIVAGILQKAGLITYRRGHVAIIDREGLEAASCECYRVGSQLLRSATTAPNATQSRTR
jgi:CRP-like cAMP-binding protein